MGKRIEFFISAILLLIVSSTGVSLASDEAKKFEIVSTTSMIADVARNIVGEKGMVKALMGTGIDPHLYKPTRSDMLTLINGNVIFYNGLFLEGKMQSALERMKAAQKKVFAVGELIDKELLHQPPEFAGHFDPHIWMDPSIWIRVVDVVGEELSNFDPDSREYYAANVEAYKSEMRALDEYAKRVLGTVPTNGRIIITAHDAFHYFGKRYGFKVLGIQGISTESEAGVRDIEKIIDLIVTRKIKAVFVETTVADRNVRALVEGSRMRGHEVLIGGALFSDAMGKSGTYEGTYIGMIDSNVTTIARALGGDAPARGMHGKLELVVGR
ncbi:MAG: zinc ABC transporter substrate-binding protein [Deltaproteobacteria bacterium]|nr:zinc ABC transporter substrate-binding protein [Deltaproteobacteria bacterium]